MCIQANLYDNGGPSEWGCNTLLVFTPHWCPEVVMENCEEFEALIKLRHRQYSVDFNNGQGPQLYTRRELIELSERQLVR